MHVYGTVDSASDSAEAAVAVIPVGDCTAGALSPAKSTTGLSRNLSSLPCQENPPVEDVGEENTLEPNCAVELEPDWLSLSMTATHHFHLASFESKEGTGNLTSTKEDEVASPFDLWRFTPDEALEVLDDCYREITMAEGLEIAKKAINSPEWHYTQGNAQVDDSLGPREPAKDWATYYGDCTDFVWWAAKQALGTNWPHPWGERPGTGNYHLPSPNNAIGMTTEQLKAVGYKRVLPPETVRPGDTVVRGGHAGIYLGIDQQNRLMGWANNGSPATNTRLREIDRFTTYYDFSPVGGVVPEYFRPLVKCTPPPASPSPSRA